MSTTITRGVLHIHSAPQALCPHIQWALEALAREPFDVLLTDVGLAGMSGIDLAREAVTRHPRLSVVIASGYAVNASDVGVERLRTMLKPYDIHQVRELLDGIRAEREALRG